MTPTTCRELPGRKIPTGVSLLPGSVRKCLQASIIGTDIATTCGATAVAACISRTARPSSPKVGSAERWLRVGVGSSHSSFGFRGFRVFSPPAWPSTLLKCVSARGSTRKLSLHSMVRVRGPGLTMTLYGTCSESPSVYRTMNWSAGLASGIMSSLDILPWFVEQGSGLRVGLASGMISCPGTRFQRLRR